MTDQQFSDRHDLQIRDFLAWQAGDVANAPTSTQIAARIGSRGRSRSLNLNLSAQLVWIVLAGLLIAALAGAVVAAALLLRSEQRVVVPSPVSPSPVAQIGTLTAIDDPLGNYCGQPRGMDMPVQFVVREFDPSIEETVLMVLPDGTVLFGKRSDLRFGAGMQMRRLTDAGLERVVDLVFAADLPDCQPVAYGTTGQDGWLEAARGTDRASVWFGSNSSLQVRRSSSAESAAVVRLAEQLQNLDVTLGADSWRDAAWQPYVPGEWKLTVLLLPEAFSACGADGPPTLRPVPSACLPWAADTTLPGGMPLINFGTLYPAVSDGNGGGLTAYRCGVIRSDQAAALPEWLGLEPGFSGPYQRSWEQDGGYLEASLTAQMPGDRGCERPEPPAPIGPPPSDLAPPVDACELITRLVEGAGTGRSHMEGWSAGGEGWWSGCYAEVSPGDIEVLVRGRITSAADSASFASSLFGIGASSERVSGRTIYWNDCFEADSGCTPAVAIESEPHLIVISWLGQNRAGFRAMLEAATANGALP